MPERLQEGERGEPEYQIYSWFVYTIDNCIINIIDLYQKLATRRKK